ncbi:MAG: SlyX protein [Bacteroidia bacterium]|jgi:SlyX protein
MSDEANGLKQQIEDLQGQLAFQEDAMERLDSALASQQREILLLQRQVGLLGERIKAHAEQGVGGPSGSPADEKPPHY